MAVGKGSIKRASSANHAVKEKQTKEEVPVQEAADKTVPEKEPKKEYEIVSAIKSDLPVHLL